MKRTKRLLILLGVLVLCCAVAFAVTGIQERTEAIRNAEEVILSLDPADVQAVSWEINEITLGFCRNSSGEWVWNDDEAFPVDQSALSDMLSIFESFTAAFAIENVTDFAQYGLTAPQCTIQLELCEGSVTLELGDYSKMDSQRYVSLGDGCVYLVRNDPLDTFDVERDDLLDHDELAVFDQITSISFDAADGYTITYLEDSSASYCEDDVYYWENRPLNTSSVDTYLRYLSYMTLTDYVTYNATEEELSAFGLSDPALTVSVTHIVTGESDNKAESVFTVHIGLVAEESETEDPTTTAYARVGDSKIIYRLAEDDKETVLSYTYNELRHANVFTADFEAVYQLDISLEGNRYSFVKTVVSSEESGTEETVWTYEEAEIEISDVQSALNSLRAETFSEAAPEGQQEIGLTIHMENDYADTMEILLYRVDGTVCLCQVNGESIAMVSRGSAVDLIEAVNAIVLN